MNGTLVATTAHTGAITTSTNQLQIGGDSIYGQYFAGLIDDVRIYNTALTATQIQTDQTTPIRPRPRHDTADPAADPDRDRDLGRRDRPVLGRRDRQRRRHRLPDRALPHHDCTFAQIGTTGGTTTTYKDTAVAACTTYSYRVRATDAAGNLSPYSNTATATTPRPTRHRRPRRQR